MRAGWPAWVLGVVLFAVAAGCSAIVDPDVGKLGSPPPPACDPKAKPPTCVCIGGLVGIQRCNEGGSYDPCVCTGTAGIGGSTTKGPGKGGK